MNNKKGFTLIELLAVILILGILLLVAIPSVTTYINNSRKETYIVTAKELIKGATTLVNSGDLDVFDINTTYYIPSSCISVESGGVSPFGNFDPAYVIVTYDNDSYNYYWLSRDETGQGIRAVTPSTELSSKLIEAGIKKEEITPTTTVGSRELVGVLSEDDCRNFSPGEVTANVPESGGPIVVEHKITCEPGTYLPQGTNDCSECPAGSYCSGGTYPYSEEVDQGKTSCVTGSYSSAGASSCTACGNGKTTSGAGKTSCDANCNNTFGVNTWNTSIWNSNNTISNSCSISSCQNIQTGVYNLKNNSCTMTATLYTYSNYTPIKHNTDVSSINLNNYYFSKSSLVSKSGGAKYVYIKADVVDNIVQRTYLCFKIGSGGIVIPGANAGEYCLKSANNDELTSIYQYNVNVLKRVFGANSSNCTESSTGYECKSPTLNHPSYDGYYDFVVLKNGKFYIIYGDPDSDSSSSENPYCIIDTDTTTRCPLVSCLSGDTWVDVYDRKKKRRLRKRLRDVTSDDLIMCWNFDTGEIVFVEPLWIKKTEMRNVYYLLEFSDGSSLKIIGDHKVFDVDRNKFVNAGSENELRIGSHVFNSNGEIVELTSWKEVDEEIESCNVITDYHMNIFANGILTSCVFSNIHDIKNMKYVMDSTDTINIDELSDIDEKYIKGLRLKEVPSNFRGDRESTISYIKRYIDMLISKEK